MSAISELVKNARKVRPGTAPINREAGSLIGRVAGVSTGAEQAASKNGTRKIKRIISKTGRTDAYIKPKTTPSPEATVLDSENLGTNRILDSENFGASAHSTASTVSATPAGDVVGAKMWKGTADSFGKHFSDAYDKGGARKIGKYATIGAGTGIAFGAAGYVGQAVDPDAVQSGGILKSGIRGAVIGGMFGAASPLAKALSMTQSNNAYVQKNVQRLGGFVKTTANHALTKGAVGASIIAGSANVHLTAPINRINNR